MILVLAAMALSALLDVVATVLAFIGFFVRKKAIAISSLALSLVAIVLSSPTWVIVITGRDTRREPITWRDDAFLYEFVIAQACVLVLAGVAVALRLRPSGR